MKVPSDPRGLAPARRGEREPSSLRRPASRFSQAISTEWPQILTKEGQNSNRYTVKKLECSLSYTKHAPDPVSNRHTYAFFVISNRRYFSYLRNGCSSPFHPIAPASTPSSGRFIRARSSALASHSLALPVLRRFAERRRVEGSLAARLPRGLPAACLPWRMAGTRGHCLSNRQTLPELETHVTHTKQTPGLVSNRQCCASFVLAAHSPSFLLWSLPLLAGHCPLTPDHCFSLPRPMPLTNRLIPAKNVCFRWVLRLSLCGSP